MKRRPKTILIALLTVLFMTTVAMKEALRLGTQDARLFYHAGMIARAAGDRTTATDFLRGAIRLNPHFDPWQSKVAQQALEESLNTAAG